MNKKYSGFLIVIIFVLIITGLLLWGRVLKNKTEKSLEDMTSREVAFRMTTDMATQFHIHPEISIIIDGVEQEIPPNIGVKQNSMTAIHTHEGGGLIHVEAPIKKDFTIGDFFAVWGKTFTRDQILDSVVDTSYEITVIVNGVVVTTYENTVMHDKDTIVISYSKK